MGGLLTRTRRHTAVGGVSELVDVEAVQAGLQARELTAHCGGACANAIAQVRRRVPFQSNTPLPSWAKVTVPATPAVPVRTTTAFLLSAETVRARREAPAPKREARCIGRQLTHAQPSRVCRDTASVRDAIVGYAEADKNGRVGDWE